MKFEVKYKLQSGSLSRFADFGETRQVGWKSPSNIALIKYWGKKDFQIPINPSISFSLENSYTKTTISYSPTKDEPLLNFKFEGDENKAFEKRIFEVINRFKIYMPFLNSLNLDIESKNSFPHSSGIASSASSMSALALNICTIEKDLFGTLQNESEFFQKASFLSRLASGSAARSVYSGYVCWGKTPTLENSSDEVAVPISGHIDEKFNNLYDAILITSSREKNVSSSKGHRLMQEHPYAEARKNQVKSHLNDIITSFQFGDDSIFVKVVENEALSLHALMMSSQPGYNLLNDNTWNIIERIRTFRTLTGINVSFTLDAGPNVHLIYSERNKNEVKNFIAVELQQFCENGFWIDDKMGKGPEKTI
ncbi:MAG: diphosphomevalonate decarboxylase [Bacteroidales bacterium]|nr:diphosphomevalonate decarboxylase [Bacteroidales bacterium]